LEALLYFCLISAGSLKISVAWGYVTWTRSGTWALVCRIVGSGVCDLTWSKNWLSIWSHSNYPRTSPESGNNGKDGAE